MKTKIVRFKTSDGWVEFRGRTEVTKEVKKK